MARQPITTNEKIESSGPLATPDTVPQAELPDVGPARVAGSVVNPAAPKIEVPRFRVAKEINVLLRGFRTKLHPGKIVDSRTYDLDNLRQQGVQLEPYTD